MADIPVVDFSAYTSNAQDRSKTTTAQEIDNAFQTVGFVYLQNHGIPQSLVDECFEWSRKFFALPLSEKTKAPHPPGGAHHRGYSAPGVEKVSQHAYDANEVAKAREIPDYKESFESGNIHDSLQPNIWPPPSTLPGFQSFMQSFFLPCSELVHRLLDALSVALNVPSPSLSSTHQQSLFQMRLLHYPCIAASELERGKRSRINAHSDFGTLTLLFQDSVGGLEVEDPHQPGVFRSVTPIADAVLVNIGDLMARWSNDRWKSTVHRVVAPDRRVVKEEGANVKGDVVPDRYSIPFFATADPETVVEALPGCWSEDNPKKYESVTAWGYVQMRMAALYEEKAKEKEVYG